MIEAIYGLLESIGFTHPLHPVIVHLPMGLIMAAFAFVLGGVVFKKTILFKTAYHSAILAIIGVVPAVILGVLDWQYIYSGEWMTPIKIKIALVVIMTILLGIIIKFTKDEESPVKLLVLYGLTLLTAIGMGYNGGELVFG